MSNSWGDSFTAAETTNDGIQTTNDDVTRFKEFSEETETHGETGRIQEDKINKKKLGELEEDGKMLQIFVRPSKQFGHLPYTSVKDIPLNAATICSNLLFDKMKKADHRYYIIEDSNLAPYNFIFNWIKQCAEERTVANVPEIQDLATSERGLQPIIDIMLVAEKLKIPTASFNKFLLKKMTTIARDYLIDLETVSRIFDSGDTGIYNLGLQDVAATSIFSHWYDYKLDAPEYDDYMCDLCEMRENIPELDAALHKAVQEKNEFLRKKRQERLEKQAVDQAGGEWENANEKSVENDKHGADGNPYAGGGDHSWADRATAGADWSNKGALSKGDWDKNDYAPVADWTGGDTGATSATSGDWADEVNDSFRPVPSVSAGGEW